MQWKSVGRPRVNPQQETDKPWTKEELTVYSSDCIYHLAIAVVKQWIADGKPEIAKAGILPWLDIIEMYRQDDDKKHIPVCIRDVLTGL